MRLVALLMLGVAGVLVTSSAGAQPESDDAMTRARVLGHEAADHLVAKDYAGALDRVTQAESLFHAPTHLRILGEAQEGLGHLADAMATYERLVAEPLPVGASDAFTHAQALARQRLRSLAARVPSLLVTVGGAPAADAAITVDGRALAAPSGSAVRLDAGVHAVRVTAPGFRPFEREVTLPDRGGVVVLQASLERAITVPSRALPPVDPRAGRPGGGEEVKRASRVPAFVAFGVGAGGVILGTVTGAMSLGKVSELKDRCPADQCAPADQPDIDRAETLATVSTIGFGVGAGGVAAGVLLLLFLPGESPSPSAATGSSAVHVTPFLGLGAAGLRGSF